MFLLLSSLFWLGISIIIVFLFCFLLCFFFWFVCVLWAEERLKVMKEVKLGVNWWFTGSGEDKDLLGGLRKRHASKGRRQGFRIHFASGTLEIIILPRLHVRRLKKTSKTQAQNHSNKETKTNRYRLSFVFQFLDNVSPMKVFFVVRKGHFLKQTIQTQTIQGWQVNNALILCQ